MEDGACLSTRHALRGLVLEPELIVKVQSTAPSPFGKYEMLHPSILLHLSCTTRQLYDETVVRREGRQTNLLRTVAINVSFGFSVVCGVALSWVQM